MEKEFIQQLDALLEKYSELLVGQTDEETKEKVKAWAMYSHIAKSMPPLIAHWSALYPDARAEMKQIIQEIKELNEQLKKSKQ
ncbi:DUF2573 family protein [Neobacillus mesonae]|uniref:DUF2573 family protein n=1 Tax=Neobacillus mesonae TaxID=1193713 RepID=UPI00257447A0|nr:DUF2573 family protein [Neobacillus mesonae]